MTDTATTAVVPNWVTLRSVEPEFLQFMEVSTAKDAIARAVAQCSDEKGHIQESALANMKRDFLNFARTAMGLPTNVGNF